MLETLIIVILVIWLVGAFGGAVIPQLDFGAGNLIHLLLLLVVILVVVRLVQGRRL